jgi:serine/threonine protein kinase
MRAPARTGATASAPLTQDWEIVGTLPYMAPERLKGRSSDARGDVFAFGALLYEMLSGRRAVSGDSPASVIADVLTSEPDPIPGLTPAIERVIRKCLAKDPDDRWQTIGDAVEGLALASTAPPVAIPRRGGPRNRQWIGAAAAVIAVAGVLFSAMWSGGYFSDTP